MGIFKDDLSSIKCCNCSQLINSTTSYPNTNEKINFFEKVFETVAEFEMSYNCPRILIMGDLNLTFCSEECKNRRFSSQEKNVSKSVKQMCLDLNLKDVWENNTKFTWRRANSDSFSTIDRILFSGNEFKLTNCDTNWSLSCSDHAAVEACFNIKDEQAPQRRSRITRLDPSVVNDPATRQEIVKEIENLILLAPRDWNPHTRLDYAKMCIRTAANIANGKVKDPSKG